MLKLLLLLYLKVIKKLRTSARIIDFALKKYSQRNCLILTRQNTAITFNQLQRRIENLQRFFNTIALKKGDVAAFSARNCAEFFEIRPACHKAGIVFFGLPAHLGEEEAIYFLQQSKAKVFFFRRELSLNEAKLREKTPLSHLIDLDSQYYKDIFTVSQGAGLLEASASDSAGAVTLNLSSGTTQKIPKIVRLADENWVEGAYNSLRNADVRFGRRIVLLCTVSYLTSGSTTFLPSFLSGAIHIILEDEIAPERIAEAVNKHKVNFLYITPSWLIELYDWCVKHNERLVSLRAIIAGTERMPPGRLKEIISFFGPIVQLGYGMVEALPPIALLLPQYYAKVNSTGKVCKGVKVKIVQDRIAVKSKTVSLGYLDNPDENARCFTDGWFQSGDFGAVDKDGFLYLSGRKDEIISETPRRVFAREVEDVLYELAWVKRASVIRIGSKICAFVSLRDAAMGKLEAIKKIKAHFAVLLKDAPVPEIVTVKDELPVNALGKLDRQALAKEKV